MDLDLPWTCDFADGQSDPAMIDKRDSSSQQPLSLGVAGLGRAFMLMMPTFTRDHRVQLAGACDVSQEKRRAFEERFGAPATKDFSVLCADPRIEVIYIATPHETHHQLALQALQAGKHVLVEKPMTINVREARELLVATQDSGKSIVVGPSHSYDVPIIETMQLLSSGKYGRVGMINAQYYTDFVFRPRRPDELDTRRGGGAIYSQGAHHADIILGLSGSPARGVYARLGNIDERRSCDGAYSALIDFENGSFASLTYSGYAHYDSDAEMSWVSELGMQKDPASYGSARRHLSASQESSAKANRGFHDPSLKGEMPTANEHFGRIIVSCQKADLMPTPEGIHVYADDHKEFLPTPVPEVPRATVISELFDLVRHNIQPVHSAERGLSVVCLCAGIERSASLGRRIEIREIQNTDGELND